MIRLLVVDPIHLTCSLLARALDHEPDLCVTGCARNAHEALAQVRRSDVILLSAELPDVDPLTLTRAILVANPATKVLLVGVPDSEELIVQGIEAGIAGYVLKEHAIGQLLTNIRAVVRGQALASPSIAAVMMLHTSRLAEMHCAKKLLQP